MITLTEIMRQREDVAFAELLNRNRTKQKKEALSVADKELICQAVINSTDFSKCVMHIFPTNKEVDQHNSAILSALYTEIVNIDGEDYKNDPQTGQMQRQASPFKGHKGDLPDTLQTAIGVCVMLTRNIDVEDGLVNGSFGKICRIVTRVQDGKTVEKMIGLELDHSGAGQRHRNKIPGEPENLVYIE